MGMLSRRGIFLTIAISVIFVCSSVQAMEGSVLLKNGKRYANVTINVSLDSTEIRINSGSMIWEVAAKKIEAIYDQHGVNIARKLLGDYYIPSTEDWPSRDSVRAAESRTLEYWNERLGWAARLNVATLYTIPTGDYYWSVKSGFGLGVDISISLTYRWAVRMSVHRTGIRDNGEFHLVSLDPEFSIVNQDHRFKVSRYLVGVEYYIPPSRESPESKRFYSYMAMGLSKHTIDLDFGVQENSSGFVEDFNWSSSHGNFDWATGFGYFHPFSRKIGVDVVASVNQVYVKDIYYDELTGKVIDGYGIGGYVFDVRVALAVQLWSLMK